MTNDYFIPRKKVGSDVGLAAAFCLLSSFLLVLFPGGLDGRPLQHEQPPSSSTCWPLSPLLSARPAGLSIGGESGDNGCDDVFSFNANTMKGE